MFKNHEKIIINYFISVHISFVKQIIIFLNENTLENVAKNIAVNGLLVDTSNKNNRIFNFFTTVVGTQKNIAVNCPTCPDFGQPFRVEY